MGTDWILLTTFRGFGQEIQAYYIEVDHLNAPTHIRNAANQIVWSWNNREPFGYIAPNEDVDGNGTYFEFNLRFPGQWFDKETALFHNGFRDYNPSAGRYMQSDPLGLEAGFNTYAYVGSNPYRAVDTYGLVSSFVPYSDAEIKSRNYSGRTFVRVAGEKSALYRVGYVETVRGNRVDVFKQVGGDVGMGQNCHGYALGLNYWIQDPTKIYEDEYDEVDYGKSTHTLFRGYLSGKPRHSALNTGFNMSFGKWGVMGTKFDVQHNLELRYKTTYYRKKAGVK